jgi:crotonobetainyl-CoA:carnitine CoA-transferase CaiB-like acyl-CoA transferase
VLKEPDLIADRRFLTNADRIQNVDLLEATLEGVFAAETTDHWVESCAAANVPCGPVNDFRAAMQDPHIRARDMVVEVDHPKIGRMSVIGVPTKFSRTPGSVRKAAPTFGQDTNDVLRSFGLSDERIDALRSAKVIA